MMSTLLPSQTASPTEVQPGAAATGTTAPEADFETLLRGVLGPAYGAALHMTGNQQDAEDLVQDAALNALRGFGSFTPGTNFKAWFFRILTNCFCSLHRKRRPVTSMHELEDAHQLYLYVQTRASGWGGNPVQILFDRLTSADVGRALDALPEEFRLVATLYFIEDFSYQQIADILGIPVGTVRSRLHRSRCMLQKQLWSLAEDQGLVSGPQPADPPETP
jgi:RNA polymerase sigma-70 factor, ECF subfamily